MLIHCVPKKWRQNSNHYNYGISYQRVLFKIAVLVFQCLAGQAPSYLSDDCQPVSDSQPRRLRSSDSLSCVVRRAHNTYGDRCFATAGPQVWNSLPAELQRYSSLRQFKRSLKTFLFRSWDYGALWLFVNQRRIEIVLLTYLLIRIKYPLSGFNYHLSDVEICNVYVGKMIIKAVKRGFNLIVIKYALVIVIWILASLFWNTVLFSMAWLGLCRVPDRSLKSSSFWALSFELSFRV